MTDLKLACRWEELAVVRKRFRLGAPWIHVPQSTGRVRMSAVHPWCASELQDPACYHPGPLS